MKIGDLGQHCGNCDVAEFCGNPFGYCLCTDSRFSDTDEADYWIHAEEARNIEPYEACIGCVTDDRCDYLPEEGAACEHNDLARDYFCEQIADFVYAKIKGGGDGRA